MDIVSDSPLNSSLSSADLVAHQKRCFGQCTVAKTEIQNWPLHREKVTVECSSHPVSPKVKKHHRRGGAWKHHRAWWGLHNRIFWVWQSCCVYKLPAVWVPCLELYKFKSVTFQLYCAKLLEEIWALLSLWLTVLLGVKAFLFLWTLHSVQSKWCFVACGRSLSSQSWTDIRPCSS